MLRATQTGEASERENKRVGIVVTKIRSVLLTGIFDSIYVQFTSLVHRLMLPPFSLDINTNQ